MKKGFKFYLAAWAVMFAVFAAVSFIVADRFDKFGKPFWIGLLMIATAFVGQLFCIRQVLKQDKASGIAYRLSLVRLAVVGTAVICACGIATMFLPEGLLWIGGCLCLIIMGITAVRVMAGSAAADIIEQKDARLKEKTAVMRELTARAECLCGYAKTAEAKALCGKVYEALRYSDPVSSEALEDIESQITLKFNELSNVVTDGVENAGTLADDLVVLVGDRNSKCKALK